MRTLAHFFGVAVVFVCALYLGASTWSINKSNDNDVAATIQAPTVTIKVQPNAPMLISLSQSDFRDVYSPQLYFIVTNTSSKTIRAYALRHDVTYGKAKSSGQDLYVSASKNSHLKPGQSASINIGEDTQYGDTVSAVLVSLDFVEFASGDTWGPDRFKTSDRLSGQRNGVRAAGRHLLEILKARGPLAVVEAVKGDSFSITPPSNHSPEWIEGFQEGLTIIRERVKHTYENGSVADIESTLRRPLDASGRFLK